MEYVPAVFWCLWIFVFGLMVGSFLNVVIARLPYEKSILWPSSRCFACYQKIRFTDNIPILGYLRLRGKCRACGVPFSARYLWVEIGTGVGFLALFVAEIMCNWHGIPGMKYDFRGPDGAVPPLRCCVFFLYHAALLSGLIAAAAIDAEHHIIPTQITYSVMAVGIIGGTLMPWPWPQPPGVANALPPDLPWFLGVSIPPGVQPWPFWGPTFDFAPPGSWQMGLLTSVFGALVGSLVIRAIKLLFETGIGRDSLGLGDADLLMMAGAFLGWQMMVPSLFVGSLAALAIIGMRSLFRKEVVPTTPTPLGTAIIAPPSAREIPFGPGIAIGIVVTWFAWPWLGPSLQFPYFDAITMIIFSAFMAVGLLAAGLFLRRPVQEAK